MTIAQIDKQSVKGPDHNDLAMLLYSSSATQEFDTNKLDQLISRAQRRNHSMGVTGAVFYEHGRFLQWLEGPADAVDTLYHDIGQDSRHTDIEMVCYGRTDHRLFSQWDMHLFDKRGQIEKALDGFSPNPLYYDDKQAIRAAAQNLYRGNDAPFAAMLASKNHVLSDEIALCHTLMRDYNRMWQADICSEFDITLGLTQLLAAFRKWRQFEDVPVPEPGRRPLLVVTLPGEPHIVGATLASEALIDAGRDVTLEFPTSYQALGDTVARANYGGVTVVTSSVFSREHWTHRMHDTITAARNALASDSRIVNCGKFGCASPNLAKKTGFDACCCSANELPGLFGGVSHGHH
ncbi:BLUF domain-containing protein [Alterisphingorhabdus coralli]|uniref:BLUF domain-containing protein n=1 Tax=Alterisphingorhabdus coralli TaxID=3071408 RepID=A0AA97F792_9SPHN|nr:BLUF domain-containing protein [Parasphingorhabdus sp. SCSIO 66989]WOE74781.1 BLUF domain-containing protein [Parasphingorhabdus sp. SCSIO 66989]